MLKIKLYGHLGKLFGHAHTLAVKTPVEAVRALQANFPGFRKALHDTKVAGYKIIIDSRDRSTPEALNTEALEEVKLVPILKGAGGNNNGLAMIVIAIIIVIVAWYLVPMLGSAAGWAPSTVTSLQGSMYMMAASMALNGVSAMLYKPPKTETATSVEQNKSNYFNGAANLSRQGNPVPLAYGKTITGSVVIHAGITTLEDSTAILRGIESYLVNAG